MTGRLSGISKSGDIVDVNGTSAQAFTEVSGKKVRWSSSTEFGSGSFVNTETVGTGDAADVQITEKANNDDDVLYDAVGNYTLSDSNKITVDQGDSNEAALKSLSGLSQNYPFTTSGNYTFTAADVEVTGGNAALKGTAQSTYGWWHLNESSGTTASDSSGNGRNGTLENMEDSDWVSGKINNCLDFDGVNERVNFGNIAAFERTNSFTFELWFKTSATGVGQVLFSKRDSAASNRGYDIIFMNTAKVRFDLISTFNTNHIRVETPVISYDDWHHIVVTYDGSSSASGVNIYVDGADQTLATLVNNLSATTVNTVDLFLADLNGGGLPVIGQIDEVVIYERQLSSAEVTIRYNSGTGTEDDILNYPQTDPDIFPVTGAVFSATLTAFTETATIPASTDIKYQVSSDDGTTWEWWNGAAWTTITSSQTDTFYYTNESNSAADINTNIGSLAASGTFSFRAFLHSSDVLFTPSLDNIFVSSNNIYSTDDNLYIDTNNTSQISPASIINWLTTTITNTNPASTDIKVLFSTDGRVNWLTWSGSAWVSPTSETARADATSVTDAQTNFPSLGLGSGTLDVRLFLYSSDSAATPTVSNIDVTSGAGFETTGTFESNEYDSTYIDLDWKTIEISTTAPVGTVAIQAKAANSSAELSTTAYGSAFSDGDETELTGEFLQWKATFTSDGTDTPTVEYVKVNFNIPNPQTITGA